MSYSFYGNSDSDSSNDLNDENISIEVKVSNKNLKKNSLLEMSNSSINIDNKSINSSLFISQENLNDNYLISKDINNNSNKSNNDISKIYNLFNILII